MQKKNNFKTFLFLDGNLVVYSSKSAVWSSDTWLMVFNYYTEIVAKITDDGQLIVQTDRTKAFGAKKKCTVFTIESLMHTIGDLTIKNYKLIKKIPMDENNLKIKNETIWTELLETREILDNVNFDISKYAEEKQQLIDENEFIAKNIEQLSNEKRKNFYILENIEKVVSKFAFDVGELFDEKFILDENLPKNLET